MGPRTIDAVVAAFASTQELAATLTVRQVIGALAAGAGIDDVVERAARRPTTGERCVLDVARPRDEIETVWPGRMPGPHGRRRRSRASRRPGAARRPRCRRRG